VTRALDRLLRPRSIAVIGGGVWCRNVLAELEKIGFPGDVWHVHPRDGFAGLDDLPGVPDAAYVGVNRDATIPLVQKLSAMGAGGAVCFASGFAEAGAELAGAAQLQDDLCRAAGDMALLGPNCYGLVNYLDRVALWPDQHGGAPVASGVALVLQSSNIAINLTMQARGLPLAAVVTAGNRAQLGLAEIGGALLDDPRVTALGLHVEGVGDPVALRGLAARAAALGKPIVALKVGRSAQARAATVSHTASLAGAAEGARALFARLGIAQVRTLEGFLEALKIAHLHGRLPSAQVAALSSSGGEASLIADLGLDHGVTFPPLSQAQAARLRAALGPRVALANPLDYHTYIWGDEAAMTAAFAAMMTPGHALGLLVLDMPRADRCDPSAWAPTLRAVAAAQRRSGRPMAVLASLAETLPESLAQDLMARGLLPFAGLGAALEAIAAMAAPGPAGVPPLPPRAEPERVRIVPEPEAKRRLAQRGVAVPRGGCVAGDGVAVAAAGLTWPLTVKATGAAHKSETGGVVLDIATGDQLAAAVARLPGAELLVEEMIRGAVAELLVGVVNDPAHGLLLTLGRGGTQTELHADTVQALLPVTDADVRAMLARLRMAPLFEGHRGRPAADVGAVVAAVLAVQEEVRADARLLEVEINPLLCLPDGCVAVDALIREAET
jgi:acyl-CoA synthetase (NDP forming)